MYPQLKGYSLLPNNDNSDRYDPFYKASAPVDTDIDVDVNAPVDVNTLENTSENTLDNTVISEPAVGFIPSYIPPPFQENDNRCKMCALNNGRYYIPNTSEKWCFTCVQKYKPSYEEIPILCARCNYGPPTLRYHNKESGVTQFICNSCRHKDNNLKGVNVKKKYLDEDKCVLL